jgi:GNAT superfamily N-acetyltransferase
MKPNWQGRGNNELSFAQAVQQKLLKFDLSIWQQLDRRQITDSQALQKFKAENERQAREAIAQGVTEGNLNEYRDQLWTWVQSKFPKTQWPEYVQRDFLYAKAKGNKNRKDLEDFLDEIQQDFGRVRWQLEKLPITLDIFTPKTQQMIQSRKGGSSNPYQVPKDAERHALQQKMIQKKGISQEPIIVAKLSNGYDLIEGWHRTIQHLKEFPQGYTAPAWVGYGATYTSESVEQGVTETINTDILNRRFRHTQVIGDYTYKASVERFMGEPLLSIKAYDRDREIGHILFEIFHWEDKPAKSHIESGGTEVDPAYRNKGVASTMYAYAKMLGNDIRASYNQTSQGQAMWAAWEKAGDAKHLATEGQEKFNTDLMKPGFRWSQEINGITYLVRTQWDNMPEVVAKVNNREVGRATFIDHHTRSGLESVSTYVSPKWQGHGIAKNMYAVVRMLGGNIQPSATQTAMGKDMWAKWEKQGDTSHIKNLNPRIKEQTVTEGQLSVDVPNEEWLQDKINYAKSKGRNSFGVPYMGSTTASVRGTPPRVRVMRLASLPGMRNEQTNVRKADLKWLMDYMDKNKRLPPANDPNEEYLPYIMVAYNGEAWVNEGNHRIMAAYRLNWQDMPIEIRYFDGGERIATGPMAPGKIGLA